MSRGLGGFQIQAVSLVWRNPTLNMLSAHRGRLPIQCTIFFSDISCILYHRNLASRQTPYIMDDLERAAGYGFSTYHAPHLRMCWASLPVRTLSPSFSRAIPENSTGANAWYILLCRASISVAKSFFRTSFASRSTITLSPKCSYYQSSIACSIEHIYWDGDQ
jgi:hypothetical protein